LAHPKFSRENGRKRKQLSIEGKSLKLNPILKSNKYSLSDLRIYSLDKGKKKF
jgi:hypothetical protein